jgi:hypothetical protein
VNGQVTTTSAVGGTSTAVPSMAGILALVIQSQGGQRLGQADYGIYNLAANHPSDFHDITQGNNSVLCTAGSTNCGSNSFMAGYNAGAGYDLATGIGSIDVAKFVNDWGTVKFATTTTTLAAGTSASSLSTSPLTVAHGSIVYFQVGVSPSTASGNVVLTSDNSQENSDGIITATISNGVASFSTQALPGGTYTLYARYGGDTANASSQSQGIQVTVSPENSSMQFNLNVYDAKTGDLTAISPASAVYGSQFYANISPYGGTEGLAKGNPATGTLALSQNGAQLTTITLDSQGVGNYDFTSSTLIPGTYTITAAYSGDSSYKPSTTTQTITISKAVSVESSFIPTNGTVWAVTDVSKAIALELTASSDGVEPTGTVAITMNGSSFGSWAVGAVSVGGEMQFGVGTSIDASMIGAGNSATFSATYSGDGNYASEGPYTTTVSVAEPANAAIALSTSGNITIATPGQSGTSTLTVTPSNAFGGSVSLTCALTSGAVAYHNPTCSIPSSVSISGTAAQTASITISTTAATSANVRQRTAVLTGLGGAGIAFAGVLIIAVPRRYKLWLPMFCFVALGAALLTIGCSAGSGNIGSGGGSSGTPAGTYTFTITGANGSISGSTTQTVTIQ